MNDKQFASMLRVVAAFLVWVALAWTWRDYRYWQAETKAETLIETFCSEDWTSEIPKPLNQAQRLNCEIGLRQAGLGAVAGGVRVRGAVDVSGSVDARVDISQ